MNEMNEFTVEQKEWLREHINNPFDLSMFLEGEFSDKFKCEVTDIKLENMRKDNALLFGDLGVKIHKHTGDNRLKRITLNELYVVEPFMLKNGAMSKECVVYLTDNNTCTQPNDVHSLDDFIKHIIHRNYERCVLRTGNPPMYLSEYKKQRMEKNT